MVCVCCTLHGQLSADAYSVHACHPPCRAAGCATWRTCARCACCATWRSQSARPRSARRSARRCGWVDVLCLLRAAGLPLRLTLPWQGLGRHALRAAAAEASFQRKHSWQCLFKRLALGAGRAGQAAAAQGSRGPSAVGRRQPGSAASSTSGGSGWTGSGGSSGGSSSRPRDRGQGTSR